MSENPFRPEVLSSALKHAETVAPQTAEVGVVATHDDQGIVGSASIDLGKPGGWSFAAAGAWMRKQKGSIAALFKWQGTPKT